MAPSAQYWIEDDPRIDDLLPETLLGVANRLRESKTFEELVYRECELDALWTLADIAVLVQSLNETGRVISAPAIYGDHSSTRLAQLRATIFEAHERASDGDTDAAAALLAEAAALSTTPT